MCTVRIIKRWEHLEGGADELPRRRRAEEGRWGSAPPGLGGPCAGASHNVPQECVQQRGICSDITLSRALDRFQVLFQNNCCAPGRKPIIGCESNDALKITRLAHSTGPFWGGPSHHEGAAPYITFFQLFGDILLGFVEAVTWQ
ncbi:hypothetical protein ILYODFUR_029427 [Ilyodon furcidens]|uniref:Uncharacterized protein n=1 Tax=Ilyodon furcidens TaxID=33524 RepID=A0ABV0VIE1_9TELE